MKDFLELQDVGVTTSRSELLRAACGRLTAIKELDGEIFINALQSSALLCLAGLRAESPYHNFSRTLDLDELGQFNAALVPHGIVLFAEGLLPFIESHEVETTFSFMNSELICKPHKRYDFLRKSGIPLANNPANGVLTYATWSAQQFYLFKMMERAQLPEVWLQSWLSAMELRFGMQLGYPGTAISAYLWAAATHRQDDLDEVVVDDSMSYFGTQISFGVAPGGGNTRDVGEFVDNSRELVAACRRAFPEAAVVGDAKAAAAYEALHAVEARFDDVPAS